MSLKLGPLGMFCGPPELPFAAAGLPLTLAVVEGLPLMPSGFDGEAMGPNDLTRARGVAGAGTAVTGLGGSSSLSLSRSFIEKAERSEDAECTEELVELTDEVESEFDVEFEFEREGTRSVCRLLLDKEAEAVEADEDMRGAGDGEPTPVGIDMRLLGKREPVVDPKPVGIALSRRFATLTLGERTPLTLPVFVSRLSLPPPLKLVGPVEFVRLMPPGRVEVDIESGVTVDTEPARGWDVERETRREMRKGVSEGGAAMSG